MKLISRPISAYATSDAIFAKFIQSNTSLVYIKKGKIYMKSNGAPLTWSSAKKNKDILEKYNRFRKEYVDTLLNEIMSELECKPACHPVSVGSKMVDSDYDITVYGPKTQIIISKFNKVFYSRFKGYSDLIFDTNIYGLSFLEETTSTNFKYIRKDPSICTPGNFVLSLDTENDSQDTIDQRVWSFVKVCTHLDKILDVATKDSFIKVILNTLDGEQRPFFISAISKYKKLKSDKSTYLKELEKYHKLRTRLELAGNDSGSAIERKSLMVRLKDQISRTNFYGVETYYTQGAFNHVVGKIQSKYIELKVYKDEYKDSFIENIGEIIKEYSHYSTDLTSFCIYTAKYIIRCLDALSFFSKDGSNSRFTNNLLSIIGYRNIYRPGSNVPRPVRKSIDYVNFVFTGQHGIDGDAYALMSNILQMLRFV